eukprot:533880_1
MSFSDSEFCFIDSNGNVMGDKEYYIYDSEDEIEFNWKMIAYYIIELEYTRKAKSDPRLLLMNQNFILSVIIWSYIHETNKLFEWEIVENLNEHEKRRAKYLGKKINKIANRKTNKVKTIAVNAAKSAEILITIPISITCGTIGGIICSLGFPLFGGLLFLIANGETDYPYGAGEIAICVFGGMIVGCVAMPVTFTYTSVRIAYNIMSDTLMTLPN